MSTMGERIRNKRIENGLSMEELGQKLGVQRAAVSKWESGKVSNIRIPTIKKMADLFGCSPAWLMGDIEEDNGYKGFGFKVDINERTAKENLQLIFPPEKVDSMLEEIKKAIDLYEKYKNAIPPIQSAVESLLKSDQSEP